MKPLLESNYDSNLDGRGAGADAGVLKYKTIILKQNSKLKKIGKRKKSGVLFQGPSAAIWKVNSWAPLKTLLGHFWSLLQLFEALSIVSACALWRFWSQLDASEAFRKWHSDTTKTQENHWFFQWFWPVAVISAESWFTWKCLVALLRPLKGMLEHIASHLRVSCAVLVAILGILGSSWSHLGSSGTLWHIAGRAVRTLGKG